MTETDTTWDIAQVARMSGVTSRTLRHYDDRGLLTPAWTGSDGRRHYGHTELLRLQHILVLRELGTSLDRVAQIVDAEDPATVIALMRDHLDGLTSERDRYARLAATVARTIDSLEKGKPMTSEQIFDGFDHEQYEPEARERWGDDAVDRANASWQRLGDDGKKRHMRTDREIVEALGAAVRVGFSPGSQEVQEVVARHHAWLSEIWTPDAEAYRSLTQMYVDDDRFRAHYDEVAPGAARLLRDAAAIYADAHL
ncbi:MerR family transcriptional regulator [Demequina zhanjiangensis]|uniref:MerR family transcriptional regulator n=1 Tax=Demequina zhanjiangensis TaxID=3051659 RepID=A0ABT8FZJ1_9MICO|nr:MerR family transcriptional regulator [Demequina sp. SYSU T00b26]MDN4471889.1 MerR family transcriptional regulator [Demequina sp. SYSU T00b26]